MVVQHNLTAINSNRMLNVTTKRQASSTEKLSSGYKINRAADDAAGLSISEKMRKQIRGLTQASTNAQDGISMVQTADGAMNEVSDMLQRMNELSVKAANGTLSDDDRMYIQNEIEQLYTEIDRVRESTKFNEIYVLKGDVEEHTKIGFAGQIPSDIVKNTSLEKMGYQDKITAEDGVISSKGVFSGYGVILDLSDVDSTNISRLYNTGFCATCKSCSSFTNVVFTDDPAGTYSTTAIDAVPESELDELKGNGFNYTSFKASTVLYVGIKGLRDGTQVVQAVMDAAYSKFKGTDSKWDASKLSVQTYSGNNPHYIELFGKGNALYAFDNVNSGAYANENTVGLSRGAVVNGIFTKFKEYTPQYQDCDLQIGADATSNNQLKVKLANLSTKAMGLERWDTLGRKWVKVDVSTQSEALEAIDTISNAIKYIGSERARMGSYQNRLEHTIANLDNVVENTTNAESSIRDTDMATEMVRYSNNNILAQAGQAMLAQANQTNQGVLSLLQG